MIDYPLRTRDGVTIVRYCLYEGRGGSFVEACGNHALGLRGVRVHSVFDCDVAIAPYLTEKIQPAELSAPRVGTLIFHPSLLPRRRGPDAVRQAVRAGDRFTGATWFWADDGYDTGPIAEQELVGIPEGLSPGELYRALIIPAGLRCFARAWELLLLGHKRAIPQDEAAATYESFITPPLRGKAVPSPS